MTRELQEREREDRPTRGQPHDAVLAAAVRGDEQGAAGGGGGSGQDPITVMWQIDTIDWRRVADGGPTAADSAAKVIAGRTAGAVVLMHLGGYTTRDALPAMVTGLRATGYTPTSISALFRPGA